MTQKEKTIWLLVGTILVAAGKAILGSTVLK